MLCSIKLVLLCVFIYGFLELREHEVMCIPQASRAKMQKNVLDIFGMENRPRPNLFESLHRDVSASAKKYMIGLYETVQENDIFQEAKRKTNQSSTTTMNNKTDVLYDADTIVSFVNNGLVPRPNASDEDGAMFFDIQSNLVIEDTLASEVRVYLNVTKKKIPDNVFKVTVYKIIIPRVKYMVLTSRIVNATESQWHEFDVLKASTAWKDDSSQNNGILVVCETLNNRARPFKECGLIDFRSEDENKPFLVSFYQSGNEDEILAEQLPEDEEAVSKAYEKERARRSLYVKERARRSLGQLFPKAGDSLPRIFHSKGDNSTCRRHPLYIAFKDLGWSDWIIAPEGYKAAYCGGECKFPLHENMNASNHAIIQTLVHLMLPDKIPEPCCAPTCLEPLKVLYLDESNNVIMKTYANMVVKDCGCQ